MLLARQNSWPIAGTISHTSNARKSSCSANCRRPPQAKSRNSGYANRPERSPERYPFPLTSTTRCWSLVLLRAQPLEFVLQAELFFFECGDTHLVPTRMRHFRVDLLLQFL